MKVNREKRRGVYHESRLVLVFSSSFTLISVYRSARTAAQKHRISAQAVSMACTGERIAAGDSYYRYIHPDVELEWDSDIGTLNLKEYDQMCNCEREYYTVREMAKKKRATKRRRT